MKIQLIAELAPITSYVRLTCEVELPFLPTSGMVLEGVSPKTGAAQGINFTPIETRWIHNRRRMIVFGCFEADHTNLVKEIARLVKEGWTLVEFEPAEDLSKSEVKEVLGLFKGKPRRVAKPN